MVASASASVVKRTERLYVELASSTPEIREALALRHRVFAGEMGATLDSLTPGLDEDAFDAYCQHLLVREGRTGRIIGCTRLLLDNQAARLGRFYSEGEFRLDPVLALPGRKLEIGRTCIDPAYRQGPAIAVLWSGLAGFIHLHGVDYLFGCASVPLGEHDLQAAAIMNRLRRQALAPETLRVTPRAPLHTEHASDDNLDAPLPALLRAYVRLGAKACGEPCRDPDFGVADVLMLLNVDELNPSYSRHFLERAAQS
ncbi:MULTISPECIES: GNAT family N-acetyltransferase [Marichromatium]|uniref:L-ornithine N(alpha)-acyltransferase n=1 Tax=Marichromatium gracile TaxID=1048 RepID=A0A4R4AG23_MARGR|nr:MULTISPECIES: GNAT family N-acyltransferase [Marichromatium]MBK1709311.1 hemolysin [Marichromatium gracile]RNE94358.1 GNAT family N-acetyltransferase [Marichromatium sp. AB32]TCW38182.1 ornithine-acyl[acyl carrier protein] N-acyltransferase [Marichromatium gracile]